MFTVLIVDDEKSIIDSLKHDIPWTNLGVETVLSASDGAQALEKTKANHIDLLITDIRMPHMDGLMLLKNIRLLYPDMHCILLTAFGEFSYAKEAMNLGVDNYLMKPMQVDELTETIENALDNIYVKRENRKQLFRENILRRWITNSISSDELGERTVLLDINIYLNNYCIVAIKKKKTAISLNTYGQECIQNFTDNLECMSVWDNAGNLILLIGGNKIDISNLDTVLYQTAKQFDILNFVNIAIGPVVMNRMDVHLSYQNACKLLETGTNDSNNPIRIWQNSISETLPLVPDLNMNALSPIVKRAIEYIQEHYSEGVSIKEFSNNLNINAAYLGCLFKKETGVFFNNFLLDIRTEKATELLCNTGDKISDIAIKTGYTTTSHFIVTFKKKTGLSPLKYREIYSRISK